MRPLLLLQIVYFGVVSSLQDEDAFLNGTFPPGFMWGAGTSNYQIEGAWNIDGKGLHIWDKFLHDQDLPNGDVACQSYWRYMEDVAILKNMGVDFYRFSIAWTRIIPNGGLDEEVNQIGVGYYRQLINALLGNGIKPYVSIYVWDLPQALEDQGGWINETIVDNFARYARVLFTEFGDLVKDWTTFNEPAQICKFGYGSGYFAPGIIEPTELPYKCGHTLLKAHATAYRIYEQEFKPTQGGQVGIVLNADWNEPLEDDAIHHEASDRGERFWFGWFAHPLHFGDYPPIMRQLIDEKSIAEGRNQSRLPYIDSHWSAIINGSLDFIGLNHYTTTLVWPSNGDGNPGDGDNNLAERFDPSWESSVASWLKVVPWGFRKLLNWIDKEYNHPIIYVTENGFPDYENGTTDDPRCVNYHQEYINQMMKAVLIDGVDVRAYTAWSLMDNLEWMEGYSQRFGIHYVNFSDPLRERVPKSSALCLTKIFQDNGFPSGKACPV